MTRPDDTAAGGPGHGTQRPDPRPDDETPPILGSWKALYGVVLGWLAFLILLFLLLTVAFA